MNGLGENRVKNTPGVVQRIDDLLVGRFPLRYSAMKDCPWPMIETSPDVKCYYRLEVIKGAASEHGWVPYQEHPDYDAVAEFLRKHFIETGCFFGGWQFFGETIAFKICVRGSEFAIALILTPVPQPTLTGS